MDIESLKRIYLKMKIAQGLSDKSIYSYDIALKKFIAFAGNIESEEITIDLINSFVIHLQNTLSINSISVQTYSRSFRCFVSWLCQNDFCDSSIFMKFKLPKAHKPVIRVLTDEEQKRLFNCFDFNSALGIRNYLICALAFGSGLRREEITNIYTADVYSDYLIVNGKGDKERFVPLPKYIYDLIQRYLTLTGIHDKLFVKNDGTPIQVSTLKQLFRRLKIDSGIPRLGMHLLRHTFATYYFDNGGSIYNLMRILGHSSLEMTKRYMHMSRQSVLRDFDNFTPFHMYA